MNDLENEINKLRYELSVTIPEELQNAVESGDLLENAEYSEILTRQNLLSIRLLQLTNRLNAIREIDPSTVPKDAVGPGSVVTLECCTTSQRRTVKIISTELSNHDSFDFEEITLLSPVAKSLYNKKLNDEIAVKIPSGVKRYKIVQLQTIHNT